MPRRNSILKVGVTGGIGSGKSEVCRLFEGLGVPVLYADDMAKELSNTSPEIQQELRELLGESAYTSDGQLDRAFVASRIFSHRSLRKKVNEIIHPRVEEAISRKVVEWANRGTTVIVVEAALIYEAGLDKSLDAVVVVEADEERRIARVVQRDGGKRENVLERMRAQMGPAEKLKKADYIIVNNGSKEELRRNVEFFLSIFQNLAGQKA